VTTCQPPAHFVKKQHARSVLLNRPIASEVKTHTQTNPQMKTTGSRSQLLFLLTTTAREVSLSWPGVSLVPFSLSFRNACGEACW